MIVSGEQAAVLEALLPWVETDGWTAAALRHGLRSMGRPEEEAPLIFPGGTAEMIEAFSALADQRMAAAAAAAGLAALRVPERVRAVIALRLAWSRPHKIAVGRGLGWAALPGNAALAARMLARTVDAVWHAAGDNAADASWYSKRAILAGVYGATLLFWLRDDSDSDEAALKFLDRRLAGIAAIGGLRRRVAAKLARP